MCEPVGLEAENVLDAMEGMGCQNGKVENVSETMNVLIWRKESFFEQGSVNGRTRSPGGRRARA